MRKLVALGAAALAAQIASAAVPVQGYSIKAAYPHDPQAFTQGLFFKDGFLWESTGQYGASSVRKVELATGKVLQKRDLPEKVFGEGIAPHGDSIVGITWMNQAGYVLDSGSFAIKGTFNYLGEGWGLTSDGERLYMSDGTPEIRVLDPKSFAEQRRIKVTADGQPLSQINELEWVDGQIYANVWQTDRIARIDPFSGHVLGWIDLSGLAATAKAGTDADNVLNGIAYDARSHRLFVTGKRWPKLFEIVLRPNKK
ncbi:glutaminyl-peptide cyclotransferase [Duganella sp. Root1480D1]|uniref:glutaminyl-peptide cyclotransferase n=1 Tax=Duganella sp. Root1480D1 TaxID=1736471 RepID=UPI00070FF56D|nr:glutaminyl-peptide cyclotransferase [Duganella sp. Root1480D1]KQZ40053.1 glutamine cyclotransferase [Duganella sp. Root1480D1]